MVDYTRLAFVKQPHRWEVAQDTSILASNSQAREIVHETNLASADAATLSTTYFNTMKGKPLAYQVEVEGVYQLEDFITSPPRFTCSFTDYPADARAFTLVGAEVDYLNNRTVLTVRV